MSAPQLSFEFYPPKTPEGATNLLAVQQQLAQCSPEFFSVTFGAGGSTRDKTFEAVLQIKNQAVPAAPHLSCVASTKESIRAILNDYRQHDIRKIVALRGDLPSGTMSAGEFRYANELVSFIRQETGDYFDIHVAAYPEVHPQAANGVEDFKNFQRKVDSGANAAITQYFYNVEAYFEFVNQCEKAGITIPIIPGLKPIAQKSQLSTLARIFHIDIPEDLANAVENCKDDKEVKRVGIEWCINQSKELKASNTPCLHYYTMSRSEATIEIAKAVF